MNKRIAAIIVLVLALVPALLIVITQMKYAHIEEADADVVVAHYLGVERRGYRSQFLILHFSDHDSLRVLWNCSAVAENLKDVNPDEELVMRIHPRNSNIMSIHCGGKTILEYEDTLDKTDTERRMFLIIGLVIYLLYAVLFFFSSEGQKIIKGHKKRR